MPIYDYRFVIGERKRIITPTQQNDTLRVATFNMLSVPDELDTRLSYVAEEINTIQPDILCLQELLCSSRDVVQDLLKSFGLNYFAYSEIKFSPSHPIERDFSSAIFSRYPLKGERVLKSNAVNIVNDTDDEPLIVVAQTIINGHEVHLISAHFYWNAYNELRRVEQAYAVSQYALKVREQNPKAVILLGGDLNSTTQSDTGRYLRGEHVFRDTSVYWSDSFYVRPGMSDQEGFTSIGNDYWGAFTAKEANNVVYTDLTLSRRIDNILSFGWVWGAVGSPLNHHVWGKQKPGWLFPPSDHFGVWSDIYLPKNLE